MPNRIIKESICTSENLDNLTPEEEIFFYRLLVCCDDYGRTDARPKILRAKCFPLRIDRIKEKDVEKWLNSLVQQKLIILYTVDDKQYIQVLTWEKHQQVRAKHSKYPAPSSEDLTMISDDIICNQNISHVTDIRESNTNTRNEYTPEFETFWNEYPRKTEKKTAFKAWNARINNKTSPNDMIQAAKNYALDCKAKKTETQFIKHPATFIGPNEPFKEYINLPPPSQQPRRELTDDEKLMAQLIAEEGG